MIGDRGEVRETKAPPLDSPAARALQAQAAPTIEIDPEKTDPNADAYEQLQDRARRAAMHSATAATTTQELRREMKDDIRDQNRKIEAIDTKVGSVAVSVGEMKGQLGTLVTLVEKQFDASNERQELKLTATLDVGKQTALIPVEDAKARRENIAKVVALVTSAGFILALIKLLTAGRC